MKTRTIRSIAISFLLGALALPAAGAPTPGEHAWRMERLQRLEEAGLGPFKARFDERTGHARLLRGRFQAPGATREEAARGFMRAHAELFGWDASLAGLHLAGRSEDAGGVVLAFRQRHRGLPVFEGEVRVGFDSAGSILHVQSGFVPALDLPVQASLSILEAIRLAGEALGRPFDALLHPTHLTIVRGGKGAPGAYLAWEVRGVVNNPPGRWLIFVDARTGAVVRTVNMIRTAGPACVSCNPSTDTDCGSIFFEDPVTFFDDPSLRNNDNVNGAQVGCLLGNLTSSTNLDGLYVTTGITSLRTGPPYDARHSFNERAVDEVTVYFHLDRAKRYLNDLGFTGVMNFPIPADAHDLSIGDNSYYDPLAVELHFGRGGVDDGQDAGVVYHEYGHAIQDDQVPGFGTTLEGGSMGEGFGDYWAAGLLEGSAATALGDECVAPWDATYYNPYTGASGSGCLRRVDQAWEYPRDLRYEVHDDGEIWGAALWDLRGLVGAAVADALMIKAHTFLTSNAGFIDGVDALFSADAALFGGANTSAIQSAMQGRGLPRTGPPAPTAGMTSSVPFACSTTHDYQNDEYKECAFTVPGASRVSFHFSAYSTELNFDWTYISDADLTQVQAISGNRGASYSDAVPGDTILARFKADPSITWYGFDIDAVHYTAGAGRVPDGSTLPGTPVHIELDPNGDVTLTWDGSCAAGDTDYAIYEGSLFFPEILTPALCSTGGLPSATFTSGSGSRYFLVVPNNGGGEGSYGLKGDLTERAPSSSACYPQEIAATCP
jgi:hypothetical protein